MKAPGWRKHRRALLLIPRLAIPFLAVGCLAHFVGCGGSSASSAKKETSKSSQDALSKPDPKKPQDSLIPRPNTQTHPAFVALSTLVEAKKDFQTKLVKEGDPAEAPPEPPKGVFDLIRFQSPVGPLAAYVTSDPKDGKKHPAIVWITGGDNNSIGDVWSPSDRENDQSASAFRKAGIVMMFPSQRGGNDNPGKREGFLGEVEDVLAAADHLAKLPYVDPNQIYLGGHSTGGTLAMLAGESTSQFQAVFSLGPVASTAFYGENYVYSDPQDDREMIRRSPVFWLKCVTKPMYVFEGAEDGNWESIEFMIQRNPNQNVRFFKAPGHNHFSLIGPLAEKLAEQITRGKIEISQEMVNNLK